MEKAEGNVNSALSLDLRLEKGLSKLRGVLETGLVIRKKNAFDTVNLNSEYLLKIRNSQLANLELMGKDKIRNALKKVLGYNRMKKEETLHRFFNLMENKVLENLRINFNRLNNNRPKLDDYSMLFNTLHKVFNKNEKMMKNRGCEKLRENYFSNSDKEILALEKISDLEKKFISRKKESFDNILRESKEKFKKVRYLKRLCEIIEERNNTQSKKKTCDKLSKINEKFKSNHEILEKLMELIVRKMKEKQRNSLKKLTFGMIHTWNIDKTGIYLEQLATNSGNKGLTGTIDIALIMKQRNLDHEKLISSENLALVVQKIFTRDKIIGFSKIFSVAKFKILSLYHQKVKRWDDLAFKLDIEERLIGYQKIIYGTRIFKKLFRSKSKPRLIEAFKAIYSRFLQKLGYSDYEIGLEILSMIEERKVSLDMKKAFYFVKLYANQAIQSHLEKKGVLEPMNGTSIFQMINKKFKRNWNKRGLRQTEDGGGAVVDSRVEELILRGVKPLRKSKEFRDYRARKGQKYGSRVERQFVRGPVETSSSSYVVKREIGNR